MTNATASHVIRANLTPTERKRLSVAAARRGVPVPTFVGDAIRAALKQGGTK